MLYVFAVLSIVAAISLKYIYSYWDREGWPYIKPIIPFGNLLPVIKRQESISIVFNQLYWQANDQAVGIYLLFRPAILIRNAHLAHRIMTADFEYFHDRGVYCNEDGDPSSANLFSLPGKQWHDLRKKFTPLFTSGKLREMVPTILDVGHRLQNHLEPVAGNEEVLDVRDIVSRFVQDIIATVFFGFEANCIADRDDQFCRILREGVHEKTTANLRVAASVACPGLLRLLRISMLEPEVIEFVTEIVTRQIEHRETNNVRRDDFIQLLIDLREAEGQDQMTIGQCVSNVFLFHIAGSETSTGTITFAMHELSQNPDEMRRLQMEIDEMLVRYDGEITYDGVKEMRYLDWCVKETLRKYPSLPMLNRVCTKDYTLPGSNVVIQKGTHVVIPLLAYAMDEEYFPEPNRYFPERFDPATPHYDAKAFYPFGEGPRNCIAYRMGVLVAKIGLILLFSKFSFEATRGPDIAFSPAAVTLMPVGGIPLKISNRNV